MLPAPSLLALDVENFFRELGACHGCLLGIWVRNCVMPDVGRVPTPTARASPLLGRRLAAGPGLGPGPSHRVSQLGSMRPAARPVARPGRDGDRNSCPSFPRRNSYSGSPESR